MYYINIVIIISIIILLILLLVGVFKNNEGFENRTTIGFLIPTTSKNQNYKTPLDSSFFKVLLTSIKKTNLNPKYNFSVSSIWPDKLFGTQYKNKNIIY